MTGTTIYLVDDDEAVRDGLSMLLSTYGMMVETFADPTNFLAHIDEKQPGILLLDLRMPMISGLQVQQKLTERGINWPIVMITGHGDVNACRRAFKAGISDFLSKPIDEDVLLDAIHSAQKLLQTGMEKREAVDLLASLTSREREVFDLVCQGFASKDIAGALDISARTIDAHRANIAEKLKTSSVAEFVRLTVAASQ